MSGTSRIYGCPFSPQRIPSRLRRLGYGRRSLETPPESIDIRPREDATWEYGSFDGNLLVLVTQSGRVDWLVQPIVESGQQPEIAPILQAGEDVLPIIRRAEETTLEIVPSVNRLAFGVSLTRQVAEPQEALQQIAKYLPHIDFSSMEGSDFMYQVNRRRRLASAPNAQVNRLARWSVARVGAIHVQMAGPGNPRIRADDAGAARQLLLDINTAPSTSEMLPSGIPDLLVELEALASEIAMEGDIP